MKILESMTDSEPTSFDGFPSKNPKSQTSLKYKLVGLVRVIFMNLKIYSEGSISLAKVLFWMSNVALCTTTKI